MAMFQARDTFVAELKDGASVLVTKGAAFHESHELVKKHGEGALFGRMDTGDEPQPQADKAPVKLRPVKGG